MDREVILEDQTVVIRDGHIEAVSRAADVDSRQMRVIDGHGKWLMPALAEMGSRTFATCGARRFTWPGNRRSKAEGSRDLE